MMKRLRFPAWSTHLVRFVCGVLILLVLLAVYCLNPSHEWKEGVGALPVDHAGWLPATAFRFGSLKSLGFAAALLAAGGMAGFLRRRHVEVLLSVLTAVASVTALAVLGQRLSPRPFAVFEWTGFFSYENHFAAFSNLMLPVALCLGERWRVRAFQAGRTSSPAALFFVAAGLMAAAVALCGSRAGLLIAGGVCAAWMGLQLRLYRCHPQLAPAGIRRVLRGGLIGAAGLTAALAVWLVRQRGPLAEELQFRWQVVRDTLSMGADNLFWGSGPGTFSAVFPYYQSLPVDEFFFRHAHCEPAQFFAEYGVAGCLVLLGGAALVLGAQRGGGETDESEPAFRELEGAGLLLGLGGVGLHSLIDFPFRHGLIALLSVVWITILVRQFREERPSRHA